MMKNNDSDKSNKNKQKQIQMTEKSNTHQSNHNSHKNRHYRYKKQIKNDHTKRESIDSHQVHHTTQTQISTSSDNQNENKENKDDYEDHIIFIHDDDTKEEEPSIYSIRLSQQHNNNQTHNNQPEFKDGECQSEDWDVICCKLDKNCIVYFSQLGLVTLCVCVSLYQIVSGGDNNRDFFIALLSSSLGYVLPAPTLKKK